VFLVFSILLKAFPVFDQEKLEENKKALNEAHPMLAVYFFLYGQHMDDEPHELHFLLFLDRGS